MRKDHQHNSVPSESPVPIDEQDGKEILVALQVGIDEMNAGLGRPVEEFDRELRARNNIPSL